MGLGLALMLVVMVVFGWLLYQVAIRSLLRRAEWVFGPLLFTLGLAILMEYLLLDTFGPRVKSIPTFVDGSFRLWFGRVAWHDVVLIVLAVLLILLLRLFLSRTSMGQAMRAVASSLDRAASSVAARAGRPSAGRTRVLPRSPCWA